MASHTIFYSWQSDSPNSTNRGFIQDCLERAIKEIQEDDELTLDPCLDRDTSGVPGSPEIASTIFEKIRNADVFVGDVSFINQGTTARKCPNPNVLVELGYAAGHLNWDKIICVFNKATGNINELPFDLRPRRVRAYELIEGQDKAEQRKLLVGVFRSDITDILHAPDKAASEELSALLSSIARIVIPIIIAGDEYEARKVSDGTQSIRFQFANAAESVRHIAVTDAAARNSVAEELTELANVLDEAANISLHSGSWPQFESLVQSAVAKATAIKSSRIDAVPLSEDSFSQVRNLVINTHRKLTSLCERMESMKQQGRLKELKSEASNLGEKILEISHHKIDSLQAGLAENLRRIGRELHLVDAMQIYADGGRSVEAVFGRIKCNSAALSGIADSLK